MPLSFIGAEFILKEPIAVTEFKARSLLTWMDYMLFGTGRSELLTIKRYLCTEIVLLVIFSPHLQLHAWSNVCGSLA